MARRRLADTLGYNVKEMLLDDGSLSYEVISPTGEMISEGIAPDARVMNNRISALIRKRHPLPVGGELTPKLGAASDAAGGLRIKAAAFAERAALLGEQAAALADEAAQYQREADALQQAAAVLEATTELPEHEP